jgi:hypothetical protein
MFLLDDLSIKWPHNQKFRKAGQGNDDLFGQSGGKKSVVSLIPQIFQRQHGD